MAGLLLHVRINHQQKRKTDEAQHKQKRIPQERGKHRGPDGRRLLQHVVRPQRQDPPRGRGRDGQGLQRLDADAQERPCGHRRVLRRRLHGARECAAASGAGRHRLRHVRGAVLYGLPQAPRFLRFPRRERDDRLPPRPRPRPCRDRRDEAGYQRVRAEAARAHPLGTRLLQQDGQGEWRRRPDGQPGIVPRLDAPLHGGDPERHPRRRE